MTDGHEWERIDDGETRPGWGLLLCGHPHGEIIKDDQLDNFPPLAEAQAELARLREAIEAHMDYWLDHVNSPVEVEEADRLLWAVLYDETGDTR